MTLKRTGTSPDAAKADAGWPAGLTCRPQDYRVQGLYAHRATPLGPGESGTDDNVPGPPAAAVAAKHRGRPQPSARLQGRNRGRRQEPGVSTRNRGVMNIIYEASSPIPASMVLFP